MSGHEISVHTWSHHPLTSLTNEQIVAELGWTRKAIKTVLGVTPVTMRPPYGDIDDRVRAIALAMGMVPVIWTRTPEAGQFDTDDWEVAAGGITAQQSVDNFSLILGNASAMDSGIIVLEHDIHEQTVDLAIGYYLPAVLSHQPPFKLKPVGECQKWPAGNMYLESTSNTTFPHSTTTANSLGSASNSTASSSSKAPSATGIPAVSSAASLSFLAPAFGTVLVSLLMVMGGTIA